MAETAESSLSDEKLMRRVKQGDKNALGEIYRRYSRRLLYFFYRMLNGDEKQAQDFLQDVFVKIGGRPELFDPQKRFSTWLFSIARNMIKNWYRQNSVKQSLPLDHDHPACFFDNIAGMENAIDFHKFYKRLREEILALGEEAQSTFWLRFQENMTAGEIGRILGRPEGTIHSRLHYIIRKMSVLLKDYRILAKEGP
jgi:RNA polymerase sigma-70 factor (ECF subfamily)